MERNRPVFVRRPLQLPPRDPRSCAKTQKHTAATPSEPALSPGRSVSTTRSIRGKSNHGSMLRQPCRCCLKGTCTRTPCEYWRPSQCQFYKTKTGCKSGDTCLFPHHKVDEQPNKRPKKGYFQKEEKAKTKALCVLR